MISDRDWEALVMAKRRYRAWVDHMGSTADRSSLSPHSGALQTDPQFFYFQQYINVRNLPDPQTESDLREQLLALGDRGESAMNTYAYQHPEWAHFMSLLAASRFPTPLQGWSEAVGTYELSVLLNQVGCYCFVMARMATADLDSWHTFHYWLAPFANEEINRRYAHLDELDRACAPHIIKKMYCAHGPEDWVIFVRLLDDNTIVLINYLPGPTGVAIIPVREVPEMPAIRGFFWKGSHEGHENTDQLG